MIDRQIVSQLQAIAGAGNVFTTPEECLCYSYDATTEQFRPEAAVQVQTAEQVSQIMKLAGKAKIPVVPRGAGTGLSGGSVPARGGIVLDLSGMNRILSIDTENLVAVVEPGVITADLHRAVEDLGLFYPPDPASLASSTLGGNVAECSGGPHGVKYGVTKDYVLGLEVVLPTGEIIHTGGQTMKNVTGYDLTKLFTGSEGTLGVITKIILRLIPKPEYKQTILATYHRLEDATATVSRIIAAKIIPTTLELMDSVAIYCVEQYLHIGLPLDVEALLLIEVDGFRETVEKQRGIIAAACRESGAAEVKVAATAAEADDLWRGRRAIATAVAQLKPSKISEDITVPRSKLTEMVRRVKEIAKKHEIMLAICGHAGDGNLHPMLLVDIDDHAEYARAEEATGEIFRAALELGGTLSGEHGIGLTKAPFLELEAGRDGIALMEKIKRAIDPGNILNPGKMFRR